MEVVERVDRFVQVAAMAEALDDLSADSEQGFGVLRAGAGAVGLRVECPAVVLQRDDVVVGGEVEIAQFLGLVLAVCTRIGGARQRAVGPVQDVTARALGVLAS